MNRFNSFVNVQDFDAQNSNTRKKNRNKTCRRRNKTYLEYVQCCKNIFKN